jgi:hypothetical protein
VKLNGPECPSESSGTLFLDTPDAIDRLQAVYRLVLELAEPRSEMLDNS